MKGTTYKVHLVTGIITGFAVMLMCIFIIPNNVYHYEGRASFYADTVNEIMAYGGKSEIIGVSDLNINMVDIKFDFRSSENIRYLSYYKTQDESNTYNMVAKITGISAGFIVMLVGFIELIRSKNTKKVR
jgi:hypothetical protein